MKETNVLFTCEETEEGPLYSLLNTELTQIKPNYDAMIRSGSLKVTDMGVQQGIELGYFTLLKEHDMLSIYTTFSLSRRNTIRVRVLLS